VAGAEADCEVTYRDNHCENSFTQSFKMICMDVVITLCFYQANSLLLHKAWAAFEGDQSSTLLLSHLCCHDDSCVLTLDSGGNVKLASDAPPVSSIDEMVTLGEFSSKFESYNVTFNFIRVSIVRYLT
jgi:hypothetical protein